MKLWSSRTNAVALALGLAAACLPSQAGPTASFSPITADFVAENSAASHTLGYFYLDVDSNGDGIPNFAQVGPEDDLDGDGIPNQEDEDDDNDGIFDIFDHGGYYQPDGPHAGEAPPAMPASFFNHGAAAADAGYHPGDYWQFVPNGFVEQNGAPYQDNAGNSYPGVFQHAGANLYVDRNDNQIPDLMESAGRGNVQVPAFALDKGFGTVDAAGQSVPGLLGSWQDAVVGETLFYLTDDDTGTTPSTYFNAYRPYQEDAILGAINDQGTTPDGNLDYLIYGTEEPSSPAIPTALKTQDDNGVRRFRYRRIGAPASNLREIVLFASVYHPSFGNVVNTYYSKTALNPELRNLSSRPIGSTHGDNYGNGAGCFQNWFPAFGNLGDHDRMAACHFGPGVTWHDIADFNGDGTQMTAHDPAHQDWVDQWQNFIQENRVFNYLNVTNWTENTILDAAGLLAGRYGIDVTAVDQSQVVRVEAGRAPQFVGFPIQGRIHGRIIQGTLIGLEDLNAHSTDRDFDDLIIMLNRPLAAEPIGVQKR